MTDAYSAAGVDTGEAHSAIAGLVAVLGSIETGRPSRSRLASGHYASVLEVAPNLGVALCTDGVGSKLIVAEQARRYGTVGIDCVAMNVNDLICVGAEPVALVDYIAVEQPDPDVLREIAVGLKAGAQDAGVEIPGGEVAVLPELIRGHPSPHRGAEPLERRRQRDEAVLADLQGLDGDAGEDLVVIPAAVEKKAQTQRTVAPGRASVDRGEPTLGDPEAGLLPHFALAGLPGRLPVVLHHPARDGPAGLVRRLEDEQSSG
mgnify:CR=1 FL=1